MKVLFIPVGSSEKVHYVFKSDVITVTYNGVTDVFDFSDFPNGIMELYDNEGKPTVETELEINPILSAKRENGELWIELLNFIDDNATEEERFPEWIDSRNYRAGGRNG